MASADGQPFVHLDDLETLEMGPGGAYRATASAIGQALGLSKIGCRLMELEPGCTGWPRHIHHANEELFVVLEGHGVYDYGDQAYPIGPGMVLGASTGPGTAHRIRNPGNETMRYLAISTMEAPEVLEYPDSGKVGAIAGSAPGGPRHERTLAAFFPTEAAVEYWAGEPDSPESAGNGD